MKLMNYIYFFIIIGILILIINGIYERNTIQEDFTPKMRNYYRPLLRNARRKTESFVNNTKDDIYVFLRKKEWL
jgi:hypothetical protein